MKIVAGAPSRVARSLLEQGPATAAELADRLALTPAMVRRHLDALAADGIVTAAERAPYGPAATRGRGRPARVYSMTSEGRDAFGQEYDDVAVGVLRFLAERDGDDAVLEFARARVAEIERRYAPAVEPLDDPDQRVAELAAALSADGYAASVTPAATGTADQLCQHHCPVSHVAEEFPQFCEAETEAFERLLGRHVTRLATIGHGDGVCTTHVPRTIEAPRTSVGAPEPEHVSTPDQRSAS